MLSCHHTTPQPTPQPTSHTTNTTNNPQPTTHNPQPTTHNPQPTTHNPQPTPQPHPATPQPHPATRSPIHSFTYSSVHSVHPSTHSPVTRTRSNTEGRVTRVTDAHVSVAACRFLWGSLRLALQRCLSPCVRSVPGCRSLRILHERARGGLTRRVPRGPTGRWTSCSRPWWRSFRMSCIWPSCRTPHSGHDFRSPALLFFYCVQMTAARLGAEFGMSCAFALEVHVGALCATSGQFISSVGGPHHRTRTLEATGIPFFLLHVGGSAWTRYSISSQTSEKDKCRCVEQVG